MIASILTLSRNDYNALKLTDAYSLHRVVYGLFPDIRDENEKKSSVPSGILFIDKGGNFHSRKILILSDRKNLTPEYGQVESKEISERFLLYDYYGFEVRLNPTKRDKNTGKTIPIKGKENLLKWFTQKSSSWGFEVIGSSLQVQKIGIQSFEKKGRLVTHGQATFIGKLKVTDRKNFINSFQSGIGRAKAFGFGLLQIIPINIQ